MKSSYNHSYTNSKYFIFLISILIFVVGFSNLGSAVNCDADLNNDGSGVINDTCNIAGSLTLNGTYNINMNQSTSANALVITASNIIFDCNNSIIYGNSTGNGIGKNSGTLLNVTIKNCIFQNYTRNMFLNNIINFSITNTTHRSFLQNAILLRNSTRSLIDNNFIIGNSTTSADGISTDTGGSYNNITNNKINGTNNGIYISQGGLYNNILYNILFNGTIGDSIIAVDGASNNTLISYNNISYSGWNGIDVEGYNDIISFNNMNNSYHHGIDFVNLDAIVSSGNNTIFNNSIYNTQYSGIYLRNIINSNIYNNYINNIINLTLDYSGIANEGNSTTNWNNNIFNNTIINSKIGLYSGSINGTWTNNYLTNISLNDIEILSSLDSLINYNIFNINNYSNLNPKFFISSKNVSWSFYNTFNQNSYFINNTYSTSGNSISNIYSLNNALIYYSNNSVACSNINSCDGNINITLSPNNYSYVLDNFNLTEGVSRTFSPLAIVSYSSENKHITNTLTDSITVPMYFSTNGRSCSEISKITYTRDTGTVTTYSGEQARNICSSGIISLTAVVDPSSSSNELDIEYGTTTMQSNILRIMIGMLALLVAFGAIGLTYKHIKEGGRNIQISDIITFFIIMIFAVIAARILIEYIYGVS